MFGGLSSGLVSDYFGRRNSILFVNIFVVISVVLYMISKLIKSYETIILARFVSGIVLGLFTGVLPIYVNECSPINIRGQIGTIQQVLSVLGKLLVNILGLSSILGTDQLWLYLCLILIIPGVIHLNLLFLTESPKYLYINKMNKQEAKKALIKLRNNDLILVENELKQIEYEQYNNELKQCKWIDFIRIKHLRYSLIITICIQLSQNLTGIDAFVFYSTDIFENIGLEGDWPNYSTIIISFVQLIMTIVSMMIVDLAGRKLLMLIGMIGISLFSFCLALFRVLGQNVNIYIYFIIFIILIIIYMNKYPEQNWLNYMTVICAVLYIISWSIGPSSIPWLITAELFSSNSRGKATSCAVFINWLSAFLVAMSFPFIEVIIK
jgi:sugar porter (SP) family MFS transporter